MQQTQQSWDNVVEVVAADALARLWFGGGQRMAVEVLARKARWAQQVRVL